MNLSTQYATKRKFKKEHDQDIQKLCGNEGQPNLRVIEIKVGIETQANGLLNKVIAEKFPSLRNEIDIHIEDAYRTINSQDKESL